MQDIAFAAVRFGVIIDETWYDSRADITEPIPFVPDALIDLRDLALIAKHYGERIEPVS